MGANAAKYERFVTTVNMWVFEETVDGRKLTEIINTDHENVKYLPGHKLPPNVVSMSASAFVTATFCILSLWMLFNIFMGFFCLFFCASFLHQVAVPDLVESVKGADILIFVVPHQFILRVCDTIKDHIKKDAIGMSLIKVTFSFCSTFKLFFYTLLMMDGWTDSLVPYVTLLIRLLQGVDVGPDGLKLISEVVQGKLGIAMTVLMGANIANEVAEEKFCETTIGV